MGCVNNVYQHQQYIISCIEYGLRELRGYYLTKSERDFLNKFNYESYLICKKYRDRAAAIQQKKIDKVVAEMAIPRVYDCEDDLPF